MDCESFEILGRWEIERGPQKLHYDFWWNLPRDYMVSSEWGLPPQFENGIVAEVEHPAAGRLRQARPAARFSATPAELRRPAPGLGEHTAEVLAEAGYTAAEVEALRAAGAFGAAQEDTP